MHMLRVTNTHSHTHIHICAYMIFFHSLQRALRQRNCMAEHLKFSTFFVRLRWALFSWVLHFILCSTNFVATLFFCCDIMHSDLGWLKIQMYNSGRWFFGVRWALMMIIHTHTHTHIIWMKYSSARLIFLFQSSNENNSIAYSKQC